MDKKNILSVTQILNQAKFKLENNFSQIWLKGEIASLKKYPSGHVYLTLKDDKSELAGVVFSSNARSIENLPIVGQEVIVNGDLSIFNQKGKFQIQISNLYESGKGKLWLAYEHLKNRLKSEGLFDTNFKKPISKYPKSIGIVTSSESAALQDILNILSRRAPHIECTLIAVPVQGKLAATEIIKAIQYANNLNLDTIIISRGGGSMEDLWCFNDEALIREVFKSKIPIISAIGHETDFTLCDYVSDLRAPTPSAAAELVSEDRNETLQLLDNYNDLLNQSIAHYIKFLYNKLDNYNERHGFYIPSLLLDRLRDQVSNLSIEFSRSVNNILDKNTNKLKLIENQINLLDPQLQLKRGFSITTNKKNQIIRSKSDVIINDEINIQVSDGDISAKIINLKE